MNDIDAFLHKYEAHASLSNRKHYAKRIPMSLSDYHRYNTAMDVYEYESHVQREPYVEMYIPQHKFQEIVERDKYFRQLEADMDYATRVVNQKMQDEIVRKNNPAVEKAFEKYKTLLELCRK